MVAGVVVQALLACQTLPAFANDSLRPAQKESGAGLEEIRRAVSADPHPVYSMESVDPDQVVRDIQQGKRVIIRTKHDRVGQDLWERQENREELHRLYGLLYDIAEGRPELTAEEVASVIHSLNHPNQAVAAAARDVIVKARVHRLEPAVRAFAERYQGSKEARGPYADYYFKDALTAFIDPVHKMELGSPTTPIFAGEMTEERMRRLHEQLKLWVNPKKKLSLLTGSGQRMAAPIGQVEAGLKNDGFPSAELVSDIGSQPHDLVKVLFALVAKLFVENMRAWRKELGRDEAQRRMPDHWSVAIGMDPRSTGPAIFQVAARVFRKMGVGVKFIGIASAPEAAARALLSDPEENLLASYEITPSHIKQGHQGTKLMLWLGQILPWAKAEEFNEKMRAAVQDFDQVKAVIEMLEDPALNAEIEQIMRRMPEEYADSKRRYHQYLKQVATGRFDAAGEALDQAVKELSRDLHKRRVTVVLDANGGARITDLPLFDEMVGGYVVIGADAAEFAHPLPPGEVSAKSLIQFGEKMADAFDRAGITPLLVNPDPDGDRKGLVYRDPATKKFLYMDPQYGFMLDVVNLDMTAREAGKKGIGIASNDATTPSVEILAGKERLGYQYKPAEVGEANVVQALNNLIVELAERYGDRRLISAGGGEGSAAAFIGDLVQVRDMFQAFGSMFNLYRKPEWVKQLIDLLIDDTQVKERLKQEVDTAWYQPGQLQYLLHRIVHRILPAMRNADPGYETEVHLGVGIPDQRPFKDTADRLLQPGGEWVRQFKAETAALISEVIGEPVSPGQITVSEPINHIEAYQLKGAGNRKLPDGRAIHDGGYEIRVSYTAAPDTQRGGAPGRSYYLYKLWLRRSKTELGVTRRLILPVVMFLPRENPATGEPTPEANQFLDGLFKTVYPRWLAFLNDLEAEELMGHVEGVFGLNQPETVKELTAALDSLLKDTPTIRKKKYEKLAIPKKKATYSGVDAENIREQDAAAGRAAATLSVLLRETEPLIGRIRGVAGQAARRGEMTLSQAEDLQEAFRGLESRLGVSSEPPAGPLSRNQLASEMAQNLAAKVFRWKVNRFLSDLDLQSGRPTTDPVHLRKVATRAEQLAQVMEDMKAFAAQGTSAQRYPEEKGVAYPNLVAAKIILSKEEEFAGAAAGAGLEEMARPNGVEEQPAQGQIRRTWLRTAERWKQGLDQAIALLQDERVLRDWLIPSVDLVDFLAKDPRTDREFFQGVGMLAEWVAIHGHDPKRLSEELNRAREGVVRFEEKFGPGAVGLIWVPARTVLMGVHNDYNGGREIVMTLPVGTLAAFRPREDSLMRMASTFPMRDPNLAGQYPDARFDMVEELNRAREELSGADRTDWNRILEKVGVPKGDWSNYGKGASLYWVNDWERRDPAGKIRGIDLMVDTPPSIIERGLSTSSLLVVAAGIALHRANGRPVDPIRLIRGSGEAEWYVGTRGGNLDHAAAVLGRRGYAVKVSPDLKSIEYLPVPKEAQLVLMDSLAKADKTGSVRESFNTISAETSWVALGLLKTRLVRHRDFKRYRRQIIPMQSWEDLVAWAMGERNLSSANLQRWVEMLKLPERITTEELKKQLSPDWADRFRRRYPQLPEPVGGWAVKRRVQHILGSIPRVEEAAQALRWGNVMALGRLMEEEYASLRDHLSVVYPPYMTTLANQAGSSVEKLGVGWLSGFGGDGTVLVRKGSEVWLVQDLFDSYYENLKDEKGTPLFSRPEDLLAKNAVILAVPTRGAGMIEPWLQDPLPRAVEELKKESSLDPRYSWIRQLPLEEQEALYETVARVYRLFPAHMDWTARYLVQERVNVKVNRQTLVEKKADGSWVTVADRTGQERSNEILKRYFPQTSGIGEEGDLPVADARSILFSDPVDGTSAYLGEGGDYLSSRTLAWRGPGGIYRPVLTLIVAPEYRSYGEQGLRMVTGLGIGGAWVNGRLVQGLKQPRPLGEIVGAVGSLADPRYEEILKRRAGGVKRYPGNMAMFEIPLSLNDKTVPGML
ncbi:MAG: hypothetical protein HYZ90_03070, partial [Candidatus Omnitrophica bacterium]|nr:hypothetical protein [Candidatus Omnitrophota bacterium]